jgi:Holliday junction resolvase RusA-like endonuclease
MNASPLYGLTFEYRGPVCGVNRRLDWSPRTGKAYPSRSYATFKRALALTIQRAMGGCPPWPFPLDGPQLLLLDLGLPPRMDTDALIKPVLDALQLAGALTDDHQIEQLRVRRLEVTRNPWLLASLCPLHTHAAIGLPEPADPSPQAAVNPHNHTEDV